MCFAVADLLRAGAPCAEDTPKRIADLALASSLASTARSVTQHDLAKLKHNRGHKEEAAMTEAEDASQATRTPTITARASNPSATERAKTVRALVAADIRGMEVQRVRAILSQRLLSDLLDSCSRHLVPPMPALH